MALPVRRRRVTFMDEMGIVWTVHTVLRRHVVLGIDRDSRDEYHDTWLVFESRAGRKRLTTFPENWNQLTESELAALAEKAAPWRMR